MVEKQVVKDCMKKAQLKKARNVTKHNKYTPVERAVIGKYAAENGPTKVCNHFSKELGVIIVENTARKLRDEYLIQLKVQVDSQAPGQCYSAPTDVHCLPTKRQGRLLLLAENLDGIVQNFIHETRKAGEVINTSVVVAMATGIIKAKQPSLLSENGGHLTISPSWTKSVLGRMGYVKRKCSNAGKVALAHFKVLKEEFLADVIG